MRSSHEGSSPLFAVGKVIKVAADFIGLLVLGVFNASIAADSIRPEFKCGRMVRAGGGRGRGAPLRIMAVWWKQVAGQCQHSARV